MNIKMDNATWISPEVKFSFVLHICLYTMQQLCYNIINKRALPADNFKGGLTP